MISVSLRVRLGLGLGDTGRSGWQAASAYGASAAQPLRMVNCDRPSQRHGHGHGPTVRHGHRVTQAVTVGQAGCGGSQGTRAVTAMVPGAA
jgi:hypothetical protein